MPICQFADQFAMFDVTPLENLFIEEFMLRAPGEYVKVYVYGLRLCYHPSAQMSTEAMARNLGMEEETVLSAFAYWERMGILRRVADNPASYAFLNVKEAVMNQKLGARQEELPYREFNNTLQDLFGERILQAPDYQRMYGWVDDLNLGQDAVLELVAHMVNTAARKQKVSLNVIEKEAKLWAKKGITNKELAKAHLRTLGRNYEGARQVLRRLGLNRAPTVDEEELYAKWLGDWGFDNDAVLYACGETTKISNPNFAYIDAVLKNMRKEKRFTPAEMEQGIKQRGEDSAPVKAVLRLLGEQRANPNEDMIAMYQGFLYQGFSGEAIQMAARYCARRSGHSLEDLRRVLIAWEKEGLLSVANIEAYLKEGRRKQEILAALFQEAGIQRKPTKKDIEVFSAWEEQGATMELMGVAAETSRHAQNPFAYMDALLKQWLASGIANAEQARKARGSAAQPAQGQQRPAPSQRPGKEVSAHRVAQRSYTKDEMEKIYLDLDQILMEDEI